MKTGIVLLNLGTPTDKTPKAIRKYLREFLMDPYVIDLSWPARAALVYGIILPFRPQKVSKQYATIWTKRGSPLLFHTLDLVEQLSDSLGEEYAVVPAMRYGNPSISDAFTKLKEQQVDRILALPLYPQYSYAASLSSEKALAQAQKKIAPRIPLQVTGAFYNENGFINAVVENIRPFLQGNKPFILFSYHGVPERQIKRMDSKGHCLDQEGCCALFQKHAAQCYRAQCFETSRLIANKLGLKQDDYQTAFQSRLGRTPWIAPYTDFVLQELPKKHIKDVLVVEPSFVADCLETIEEIEVRGRETFLASGGDTLTLVPSLNSGPLWVEFLSHFVRNTAFK